MEAPNQVVGLFDANGNNANVVLDAVAAHMRLSTDFFLNSEWRTVLIGIFDKYSRPDEASNFSRISVSSIPPTPVELKNDRPPAKSFKSFTRPTVLATTPEPNYNEQLFTCVEADDEDDIIPETQFMETQRPDCDDNNSNDSFLQVQPDEFNSSLPETQTQILDSFPNSPELPISYQHHQQPPMDNGDITDCEEEMSLLEWNEKSRISFNQPDALAERPDCGSATPDLVFDNDSNKGNTHVPLSNPCDEHILDSEDIPASQAAFAGFGHSQLDKNTNIDPGDEKHDESNDLFDCVDLSALVHETPPRHSPSIKFDEAPTQRFVSPPPILASITPRNKKHHVVVDEKANITNFADAPTQKYNESYPNLQEDDAFYQPTQQILIDRKPKPAIMPFIPLDQDRFEEDDAFLQPTQMNTSTNKTCFTDAPTQLFTDYEDNCNVFNQSTQKIISKPNPYEIQTEMFVDDDAYDQPTQKLEKVQTNFKFALPKSSKKIPRVLLKRCVPTSNDTQQMVLTNNTHSVKALSSDNDDDVFGMATQSFTTSTARQTSVNYTATDSILNTTATSISPSNKENRSGDSSSSKTMPLLSSTDSSVEEETPNAKINKVRQIRRRLSSPEQDFDTPNYDFIKKADPTKIRACDSLFTEMSRKKAKMRFLFHDSSDDENVEKPSPVVNLHRRPKFVPKVPSNKITNSCPASSKTITPVEPVKNVNADEMVRKSSRNIKPSLKRSGGEKSTILTAKRSKPVKQIEEVSSDTDEIPIVTKPVRPRKSDKKTATNERPVGKTIITAPPSAGSSESESGSRKLRHNKPKILFTIVDPKPHSETIAKIGGNLVDSPEKCTVLVTSKVFRTYKFLSAMGRGISIVSESWMDECAKRGEYVDPEGFILNDPLSEKRYKFSLTDSLRAAREKQIFEHYSIFVTPSTKPLPEELNIIITCAGGKCLLSPSKSARKGDTVVAVSTKEDRAIWPKLRERHSDLLIVNTEGLMLSVMQHRINFKPYQLK